MGIKKKTFLIATCDICGIELDSGGYGNNNKEQFNLFMEKEI